MEPSEIAVIVVFKVSRLNITEMRQIEVVLAGPAKHVLDVGPGQAALRLTSGQLVKQCFQHLLGHLNTAIICMTKISAAQRAKLNNDVAILLTLGKAAVFRHIDGGNTVRAI